MNKRATYKKPLIGFIGQGYIGKNYADDFEKRKFRVIRYALENKYVENKGKIANCDIVFIAVPTPTTPKGFDSSIVRQAVSLVGLGKIAVIKSTILPGTTESIQNDYPDRVVLNSPEFLSEATAAKDASRPFSNIVGMPCETKLHRDSAKKVQAILPRAPFAVVCKSHEAEMIKYIHNGSGYVQIVFFNMMYDMVKSFGGDWSVVEEAIMADPLVAHRYCRPVHKSGRGAGGHCFIKDVEALSGLYRDKLNDKFGQAFFESLIKKNIQLLESSGKDLDLLRGVYGDRVKKS